MGGVRAHGFCEVHDKALFGSRKHAKAFLRRRAHLDNMRPYPCDQVDGAYHIGHLPSAVVHGVKTADEHYGRAS